MIVRVTVEAGSASPLARVETRDGKVRMRIPVIEPLRARMNGRTVAYFRISVKVDGLDGDPFGVFGALSGGVVEIGDEAEEGEW